MNGLLAAPGICTPHDGVIDEAPEQQQRARRLLQGRGFIFLLQTPGYQQLLTFSGTFFQARH
ncbi:hypothetical protein [Erwinia mallotivora]|uniref:hypothetical protein n=1 Tax=Erwinia mallotivora TaxID=69222 RepID=UPI0004ACD8AE|nr:hypothetical protein [Erwinia mallotivora]